MTELRGFLQRLQGQTLGQSLGQLRGVCWNVRQSRGYASCWSTTLLFWSSLKSLSAACCSLSLLKSVRSPLLNLLLETLLRWLYMGASWAPRIIRLHCCYGVLTNKTPKLACEKTVLSVIHKTFWNINQQIVTNTHKETFSSVVPARNVHTLGQLVPVNVLAGYA